ncbi:MAG: protein kinase [Myxococcota bacterium]
MSAKGMEASAEVCPECGASLTGTTFCRQDGFLPRSFMLGGRYRIDERIGGGGMGFVFGGTHVALQKEVAIKVMRPDRASRGEYAQRFLREAQVAAQLRHPNIVATNDFGHDEETRLYYLVMDRLRGDTLESRLKGGALSAARMVPMLQQLARALAHAHEAGVIHRDLTPRNVMLEGDLVRLCDFGLSRQLESEAITTSGETIGTPAFMAPEQVQGDDAQGPAIDIYAFGCVAYLGLSGSLPHRAQTPVTMIAAKLGQPPESIAARRGDTQVPTALDELIMACLATDPNARPTAAQLARRLSALNVAPDLTDSQVGSYRVTGLLGRGGSGAVYEGVHPTIGTRVAIKVLRSDIPRVDEAIERFIREARTSNSLESPYIPRYFDFGRLPDGRAFAVMEYLEGQTVEEHLEEHGAMDLEDAKTILSQVTTALAAAHAAGVVHRDIKPSNLLITRDAEGREVVKVLDFGIAKVIVPGEHDTRLTQENVFIGTPLYSAPEQVDSQGVGPEADVYALGATAFEMLTGEPPFSADDLSSLFAAKLSSPPSVRTHVPSLPGSIDTTLRRALAPRPTDRFQTLSDFQASLETWGESPRRTKYLALVAGIILGVLLVGVGLRLREEPARAVPLQRDWQARPVEAPPAEEDTPAPAVEAREEVEPATMEAVPERSDEARRATMRRPPVMRAVMSMESAMAEMTAEMTATPGMRERPETAMSPAESPMRAVPRAIIADPFADE